MNVTITKLRDDLSRLHGPARIPTLGRLGQEHATNYWRSGPGRPEALGALSAAIEAWAEAYHLIGRDDPARAQVAGQVGWLLAARHGVHGSGPEDRDTGIAMLGEALASTSLPPMQATMARFALGQLHLGRAVEALSPTAVRGGLLGGQPPTTRADADEAVRILREILDGPPTSAQIVTATRTMLTLAESIQPLLSGDLARFDIGKIMEVMAALQRLQANGDSAGTPGAATPGAGILGAGMSAPFSMPWPLGGNFGEMADPLDYPVTVIQGDPHQTPAVPPRWPAPAAGVSAPPPATPLSANSALPDPGTTGAARQAARTQLAALTGDPGQPVWDQALALSHAGPEQMTAGDLDAFVGAAANAVPDHHDVTAGDPVESGIDRLLCAVALCLRERRDGDGWGAEDEAATSGAYLAAAEHLHVATTLVPPAHPAAAAIVEALGGLLDDAQPLSGAVTDIAGRLSEYVNEINPRRATVTALGHLCRTVTELGTGLVADPDPFAASVAAVPADHPLHQVLSVAVRHTRLVAAVRTGDLATVRAAAAADPTAADPGGLVGLLDALVHDDTAALRTAVDATERWSGRRTPQVAAILGAIHLELSTRPLAAQDRDDLTAAIRLLSEATQALDDVASQGLRTRSWWRLAAAYRRRAGAGDSQQCRDAGRRALRGAGQDPASAARFAGWMLADGRAEEAFTALEVTAAGGGRPDPGADPATAPTTGPAAAPGAAPGTDPVAGPIVDDVLAVLIGVAPRAAPPPEVPTPADVARAVRETGAAALVYLHPTDEAGRTAAAMCLDPATDRLDLLANVPVTDPLITDDPGWPAIVARWTGYGQGHGTTTTEPPRLLVAATGRLDRVALPAVRIGDGRRLAQDVVVSHVASGAQVARLAPRPAVPVAAEPLFVVNPRGDRDPEMADVLVLRRMFYPRSACLGRALEPVDAAGTLDDVLARLPGASLVHLACGRPRDGQGELQLAGEDVLDVAAIRSVTERNTGGGLVVLAESGTGYFAPIAESFLDAGFSGVIGWQWPVPAPFAALALFLTHLMLAERHLPPASAVNAVHRWMLDPERDLSPVLTGAHRNTVATVDLTRPALWAALAYRGC